MSEIKKFKTLEKWIREALADDEKDGPCTGIAVIYKKPEGGTKEIDSIKLSGKTWDTKLLAERVQGKAETYAQDLPGVSNFAVLAFFKERKEAEAELPFVVIDGEVSSGGVGRKIRETPDTVGLTAQLMRHLERKDDTIDSLIKGFAAVTLQRETKILEREEKMREEVNDAYAIVRELVMKAKQDDQKMVLERMQTEQSLKERSELMRKAPLLLNAVSGKEIFPQEVADTALIESIAEQIDVNQIDQLEKLGLIKGEAVSILKLRILKVKEQRAKEAEAAKILPEAKGDTLQ